jgi:parvulin-like peptidyl-prolyl isomerase
MPPELAAVAFSLTNNQISDVINLPYGCCIVKLLEKIPARKEPFAGLDTNTTLRKDDGQFATIREVLSDKSMQKQAPAYLSKLRKEADVEILDPRLQALEAVVEAAASNSPAMTPEK